MSQNRTVHPRNQCQIGVWLFCERSKGGLIASNVTLSRLKIASSWQRCLQHFFFSRSLVLICHFSADLDCFGHQFYFVSRGAKEERPIVHGISVLCVNECVFTGSTTAQLRVNKNKTELLFLFCVTGLFVLAETSWDHLNDGHHTSSVYLS